MDIKAKICWQHHNLVKIVKFVMTRPLLPRHYESYRFLIDHHQPRAFHPCARTQWGRDGVPRKTRALLPRRCFWTCAAVPSSWRRGERNSLCLAPCTPRSSYWLFCCASFLRRWATSAKNAAFICPLLQVSHILFILLYNPVYYSSNYWDLQMEPCQGPQFVTKDEIFFYCIFC